MENRSCLGVKAAGGTMLACRSCSILGLSSESFWDSMVWLRTIVSDSWMNCLRVYVMRLLEESFLSLGFRLCVLTDGTF